MFDVLQIKVTSCLVGWKGTGMSSHWLIVKWIICFFFYFRAALGGHAYICQTLIKYGVDPNIKDSSG